MPKTDFALFDQGGQLLSNNRVIILRGNFGFLKGNTEFPRRKNLAITCLKTKTISITLPPFWRVPSFRDS